MARERERDDLAQILLPLKYGLTHTHTHTHTPAHAHTRSLSPLFKWTLKRERPVGPVNFWTQLKYEEPLCLCTVQFNKPHWSEVQSGVHRIGEAMLEINIRNQILTVILPGGQIWMKSMRACELHSHANSLNELSKKCLALLLRFHQNLEEVAKKFFP